MDDVESQSFQIHKYYRQLVDFFWVNGFYSITMALWLIFGKGHHFLSMFNLWFLASILLIELLDCLLVLRAQLNLFNIFFLVACMNYLPLTDDDIVMLLVISGVAFVITGVLFGSLHVSIMNEKCQESEKENFIKCLLLGLNMSCTLLLNGYATSCCLLVTRRTRVWKILGIGLLGILGLLSVICCVLCMVGRWKEYCRSRACVQPTQDLVEV